MDFKENKKNIGKFWESKKKNFKSYKIIDNKLFEVRIWNWIVSFFVNLKRNCSFNILEFIFAVFGAIPLTYEYFKGRTKR